MSSIVTALRRLFASFVPAAPRPSQPECLSLREWADLPSYHPINERAPC